MCSIFSGSANGYGLRNVHEKFSRLHFVDKVWQTDNSLRAQYL